jgi:integrase
MATLKFVLQGKSETVNIYARYSVKSKVILYRKTGFVVSPKNWDDKTGHPTGKADAIKNLKIKLEKLKTFIDESYNKAISNNTEINGDWLQTQIDLFNNKIQSVESDYLLHHIQEYIDKAPMKANRKKTGLSKGRIRNIELFKSTIKRYQSEALKGKQILVKDIDLKFAERFKTWLFAQNYTVNYVGKNIANLKTICFDAEKSDTEINVQFKSIKTVSEQKEAEDIVFLNEEEQEAIKNATLTREALINARKWLLLGCLLGQRGGDLLNITEENIVDINGIKMVKLKQQKTGKLVSIPLLPEALEIIADGLPYKTSLERFNEYIKDVCEEAGINQLMKGRVKISPTKANTNGMFKKYELITSHVCRRSFATNYYSRVPTPILMNITAHGTEKVFLLYIGQPEYDNAMQMYDYVSKLEPKKPKLEVVHNTGTE